MGKKLKKAYGRCLNEIDVCNRVSTVQLFDRSIWINLQDGNFQEKVTGNQQNVKYIYRQIWRGMAPNSKGSQRSQRIVCSRKWSPKAKLRPLKQISWRLQE